MITPLQPDIRQLATPQTSPAPKSASATEDFRSLFAPAAKAPADTAPPAAPASAPAAPAPRAPVSSAAADSDFSPRGFENRMNSWLMGQIEHANSEKLKRYDLAMSNWKLNEARRKELGLPSQAPPAPPALEEVAPKPDGFWFS